jgi:hypothetical protein
VETQKTRAGNRKTTGQKTRPYRFGEFDILAVSMEPATGDWSRFRFTVGNWLLPRKENDELIAVYQPVSRNPNHDWTDSLETAIEWFQSGTRKTISVEDASWEVAMYTLHRIVGGDKDERREPMAIP